jgi:hypothetical protein
MHYIASVIISFYNKIDVLKLVLSGFERQSEVNFGVLQMTAHRTDCAELKQIWLIHLCPFHISGTKTGVGRRIQYSIRPSFLQFRLHHYC